MKPETLDNILGEALEAAGVYRAADVTGARLSHQDWTAFLKENKTQHHRGLVLIPCSSIEPGTLKLIR